MGKTHRYGIALCNYVRILTNDGFMVSENLVRKNWRNRRPLSLTIQKLVSDHLKQKLLISAGVLWAEGERIPIVVFDRGHCSIADVNPPPHVIYMTEETRTFLNRVPHTNQTNAI